jgi:hypothetical protein
MLGLRLKVMFALFALATLVNGFVGFGNCFRYSSPKRVTYSQFVQEMPREGWYEIRGCYLDLTSAVLLSSSSDGYFVPLRSGDQPQVAGQPGDQSQGAQSSTDPEASLPAQIKGGPQVLVYVGDTNLVREIDAYNNASNKPMTVWGMAHVSQLGAPPAQTALPMTVSGMVDRSVPSDSATADKLAQAAGIDGDLVTIDQGVHPNFFLAIAKIAAGIVMVIASLWTFGIHLDPAGVKEYFEAKKAHKAPDLLRDAETARRMPQGQAGVPPNFHYGHPQYPAAQPPYMPGQAVAPPEAPVPPPPQEPETPKVSEDVARLRDMKPFDPFGEN